LSELLPLFVSNILPILLVAMAGILLGRFLHVNPDGLSKTVFYILTPCLLFNVVIENQIQGVEAFQIFALAILLMVALGTVCLVAGRLLRLERNLHLGVILAVIFMNSGNFGLSLNLFAFGDSALAYASIFFAIQVILVNTIGVMIASMGNLTIRQAAIRLAGLPSLYALGLALAVRFFGISLPPVIQRPVGLLGQAAIPIMLLIMGLQLQKIRWAGITRPLVLASGLRLVASPVLAILISGLIGISGTARQASILESATPTAVIAIVLGTEFEMEPLFLTSVVLITTLLSPLTLTPILAFLGA
jgi:malate permease and related proteins